MMTHSLNNPYNIGYSAGLNGEARDYTFIDEEDIEDYDDGFSDGSIERANSITDPIPDDIFSQLTVRYGSNAI